MKRSPQFRAIVKEVEIRSEHKNSESALKTIKEALDGLRFSAKRNKRGYLITNLDEMLLEKLENEKLGVTPKPTLRPLEVEGSRAKEARQADAIVSNCGSPPSRVAIEIEKTNYKNIWMDFIKLWGFIQEKQADLGLLIVPLDYFHGAENPWNLWKWARKIEDSFRKYAGVPEKKIRLISLIGYRQEVLDNDGRWHKWNSSRRKKQA